MGIFLAWYLSCGAGAFLLAWAVRAWRDGAKSALLLPLMVFESPLAMLGLLLIWPVTTPILFLMSRHIDELRDGQPRRSESIDSVRNERAELVGTIVEVATDLKPGGKILLRGERQDAFSRRGFVPAGARVEIVGSDDLRFEVVALGE